MEWLLERFPLLIAIVVVIVKVLQAVMQSRNAKTQHEQEYDETEEQRRVREIQERIRRSIAERRGQAGTEAPRPAMEQTVEPPVLHQETPIDEDGDPFRDRDGGAPVMPEPQVAQRARNAELERQQELADKMRELAAARDLAARRAANAALMNSESAQTTANVRRQRFDDVLHDRDALRRAIVLREVLGPPVGLR
jgi:hypothetical protein